MSSICLIAEGSLYLKADAEARDLFSTEGATAFSYYKQEKECRLSYYLAAEAFFEDSDACLRWERDQLVPGPDGPVVVSSKPSVPSGPQS